MGSAGLLCGTEAGAEVCNAPFLPTTVGSVVRMPRRQRIRTAIGNGCVGALFCSQEGERMPDRIDETDFPLIGPSDDDPA